MKILIVHGFRPLASGDMHPDFKIRLDKALELDKLEKFDAILISGGATRKNVIEAYQAEKYLKGKTNTPLILEDKSHSTSENVRLIKEKLESSSLDKVVVIVSEPYLKRTKYAYSVLWPELKPIFLATESGVSPIAPIREFFYRIYTHLDPSEKFLPVKIFKRFLRS